MLSDVNRVKNQVRGQLIFGVPDGARLLRVYDDLGAAEAVLASPMIEVPEESRPVSKLEDWIRDLLREAQGILEAVPA